MKKPDILFDLDTNKKSASDSLIMKQNFYILQSRYTEYQHIYTNGWLVGCFGFNGALRQYFSLYRAVSQREGERGERKDR